MQRGCGGLRFLTDPNEGAGNQGWDNKNSDLIIAVGDIFQSSNGHRYLVKDMLGQGTFGQVVKCYCEETGELLAVKVIKNQDAFFQQARVEVGVLQFLNKRVDVDDEHHIVRMQDCFLWRKHLCLVFELLSVNLYELLKHNHFKGLSLGLLNIFIAQILECLAVLRENSIIHCDLKPENVLLQSLDSGSVKVIDFGSACFETKTTYSYIQSRFYRSPEVLMGHSYDVAIDMWSLGCMAAELFLGLPLFPGASEHDLLVRIVETLGLPPEKVLKCAAHTYKFFTRTEENVMLGGRCMVASRYQVRSQADFESINNQQAPAGKRYFNHSKLADIICTYPFKSGLSDEKYTEETERREVFLDFLMGVLDLDPTTRWSPRQALKHPFIKGKAYKGSLPFQPEPDPHVPQSVSSMCFQPSSYTAASPFAVPISSHGSMIANSPEAHAQAHAAAMAALNAHFSPRQAGQLSSGNAIRSNMPTTENNSISASSFTGQQFASASASRRGGIPTPPSQQYTLNTPPGNLSGPEGMYNQLSPANFCPGQGVPLSPMGSGSYLRPNSLARVLAPWSQQGAVPQSVPFGSLEALRATWRAPHNSYNTGGYLSRTGRMGSGNLGNNVSHSTDRGLPPLPSASLLGEGREAFGQAQAEPRSRRRPIEGPQLDPGRLQNFAEPMGATPQDQYSLLLNAVNCSGQGAEAQTPSHYNLHSQMAQPLWREKPDQFSTIPSNSSHNQPQPGNAVQPGMMRAPFQTDSDIAKLGPVLGGGEGGEGSMTRSTSGMWHPVDPSQRRMLSRGMSGESAVPEPGDWDPLYSDEQLLSEETAWRANDASVLSHLSSRSRPQSGPHMLMEPQGNDQVRGAQAQQSPLMGGLDSLSMLAAPQWAQAMQMSSDNLASQGATDLPERGASGAAAYQHMQGSFPGGSSTWQHPAMSASLYPLPEAGAFQDPSCLANQTTIPPFTPAGIHPQQGTQA